MELSNVMVPDFLINEQYVAVRHKKKRVHNCRGQQKNKDGNNNK